MYVKKSLKRHMAESFMRWYGTGVGTADDGLMKAREELNYD